jgi:hypothetical protein
MGHAPEAGVPHHPDGSALLLPRGFCTSGPFVSLLRASCCFHMLDGSHGFGGLMRNEPSRLPTFRAVQNETCRRPSAVSMSNEHLCPGFGPWKRRCWPGGCGCMWSSGRCRGPELSGFRRRTGASLLRLQFLQLRPVPVCCMPGQVNPVCISLAAAVRGLTRNPYRELTFMKPVVPAGQRKARQPWWV